MGYFRKVKILLGTLNSHVRIRQWVRIENSPLVQQTKLCRLFLPLSFLWGEKNTKQKKNKREHKNGFHFLLTKLGLQYLQLLHYSKPRVAKHCLSLQAVYLDTFLEKAYFQPPQHTGFSSNNYFPPLSSPPLAPSFNLHPSQPPLMFRNALVTQIWYE